MSRTMLPSPSCGAQHRRHPLSSHLLTYSLIFFTSIRRDMAVPSVAYSNPRTAEFARLFDIFDRVATRRSQATAGTNVISADDIAHVPAEFAPVLKSLSVVLTMRAQGDTKRERRTPTQLITSSVPLRDTVPKPSSGRNKDISEGKEEVESPTFPLSERYPFTFKLMLHKLYDLDEWAAKVSNALEASKSQFKPLAEKVVSAVREARGKEKTTDRKGVTRARSHSVLAIGGKSRGSVMPRERANSSARNERDRALKKRCVGRRKSVSGPMEAGVWVYDAAISAVEVDGPRPAVEITLSETTDRPSGQDSRTRHQSLAGLEGIRARDTARRKVRIEVPIPRHEDQKAGCSPGSPMRDVIPIAKRSKESVQVKDVPRKRRAMESVDNLGGVAQSRWHGHGRIDFS
ncbi:hypothetical protein EDC04DRAFT_370495 [Pisolithus marmoratus]|nr:hypothetical protein EDC04DRAFT_370495 [Pisolithus marmoratus]